MALPVSDPAVVQVGTSPDVIAQLAAAQADAQRRIARLEATAGAIGVGGIRGDQAIAGQTITAASIQTGSLTADLIDVSSLDAISAVMGNLTVNGTLTISGGGNIRTTVGSKRTEYSAAGIKAFDTGTLAETFNLSSTTGILTCTAVLQTGSSVPGSTVIAGTLDLSKLASELAQSVGTTYVNAFDTVDDCNPIVYGLVAPTIAAVTDATAMSGTRVCKISVGSGIYSSKTRFAFDPGVLYRVRARVRQKVDPTGAAPNKNFYVGVLPFDQAGASLTAAYVAAAGATVAAGSAWTTVTGYFKGIGTVIAPASDPTVPSGLPTGSKTFSPIYGGNWQNGAGGEFDIDYIAVDQIEIPAGSITSTKLYSGLVEADLVQAINLSAGSITAAKIGFTQGGHNHAADSSFENLTGSSPPPNWIALSGASLGYSTTTFHNSGPGGGIQSMLMTATGAGAFGVFTPYMTVVAGDKWTWSWHVYNPNGTALTPTPNGYSSAIGYMAGTTRIYDDGGTKLAGATVPGGTGKWYRVVFSTTIPVGTTLVAWPVGGTPGASGNGFYFDDCQLERGDAVTAYRQYIDPTAIDGRSITSALIQTAVAGTNPRVSIDSTNGFVLTDATGLVVVRVKGGGGGIDLASGTTSTYVSMSNERKLRWVNTSGNSNAELHGAAVGTTSFAWLYSKRTAQQTADAISVMGSYDATFSSGSFVRAAYGATDSFVDAQAESYIARVIDWQGRSSFPILANTSGLGRWRVSWHDVTFTFTAANQSANVNVVHSYGNTANVRCCGFGGFAGGGLGIGFIYVPGITAWGNGFVTMIAETTGGAAVTGTYNATVMLIYNG